MLIVPFFERLNKLQPWTKMGVEVFVLNLGVGRLCSMRCTATRCIKSIVMVQGGRDFLCVGRAGSIELCTAFPAYG